MKREQDKTVAEIVADQEAAVRAAQEAERTPERLAEIERERRLAEQVRSQRGPIEMKPGTLVKMHTSGWRYDPKPAEVVSDNMDPYCRLITAKRTRGGQDEFVTLRSHSVSLWRA